MIRNRILLGFVALLLAAFAVSSCSKIDLNRHPPKKTIAFVAKTKQSDYWKTVQSGAEAAAKEFDVDLSFLAPADEEDTNGQLELVNQALKNGAGALVLGLNDYRPLAPTIERAGRTNIPVIAVDMEADLPYVKSYIGADNYNAGKKAAEKLVELSGENSRVAVITYVRGIDNTDMREKGLLDELAKHPQLRIVAKEFSLSDRKLAADSARVIMRDHPDVNVIVALNAVASVGVADEIVQLGLGGKVKIITFDSTPELLEWMQENIIQATIIQNPFSMGYLGVKYALDALNGKKIPERVDTGTKAIDPNNMFWSDNQKLLFPFVK